ncbi:MAG: purine-nucleoside phosphorylase [Treponema sp.]|jgi:purine-nucleoside phosphorylase|nr:purine-nucleoside phosphorylase [Treponema sp.]
MENLYKKLTAAADYICTKAGNDPIHLGMVLGSGLGDLGDQITDAIYIPYKEIPHFPLSTVPGHKGRLVIGMLENKKVLCMQGRFHYYEGYGMDQVVFPIQVMKLLGIKNLLLTNAAGCVNTAWHPGDLMIITDHIKLSSENPMRGPNCDELGDRFFDMSHVWSKDLQKLATDCGQKLGITLRKGVYQLFTGPSFETPAEVKFARFCGADAVGMSTVPEAIAAGQMHMNLLGISCLTNMAAGILDQPLNHKEVLETGEKVKDPFISLVRLIVKSWA